MTDKPLILAVDDEEDFLEIASVYLRSSGFQAATLATTDSVHLIRRCVELQPVLALIDVYDAGEPTGVDLAAALKNDVRTSHIKVILWSSVPCAQETMADDFFNKSEDLNLLIEKIWRHLPLAAAASSPPS